MDFWVWGSGGAGAGAAVAPLTLTLSAKVNTLTFEGQSMSTSVTIVQGDTAGAITITLADADGPKGLSGATVRAYLKNLATNVAVDAACTIVDAEAIVGAADRGKVEIPEAARAAWAAGIYTLEVLVTYADGSLDWWPSEHFAQVELRARRTA